MFADGRISSSRIYESFKLPVFDYEAVFKILLFSQNDKQDGIEIEQIRKEYIKGKGFFSGRHYERLLEIIISNQLFDMEEKGLVASIERDSKKLYRINSPSFSQFPKLSVGFLQKTGNC